MGYCRARFVNTCINLYEETGTDPHCVFYITFETDFQEQIFPVKLYLFKGYEEDNPLWHLH